MKDHVAGWRHMSLYPVDPRQTTKPSVDSGITLHAYDAPPDLRDLGDLVWYWTISTQRYEQGPFMTEDAALASARRTIKRG